MDMFSIMLMAITIAWDDARKKMSKRRPENEPALDSSSREVNSRVEALRFDRRAGALALHFLRFLKPLRPFVVFYISTVFFFTLL
mgnify:CR=1 FL=1